MYTRSFGMMPRTVNGLMEDVFNGMNRIKDDVLHQVPVNIVETETGFGLQVIAPGLKKEEFKISVDKDLLHISFDHKEEKTETPTTDKWLRTEYKTRSFKRSFNLTEKVDATKISAKYTDGILYLELPKKEVAEPAKHEIAVN